MGYFKHKICKKCKKDFPSFIFNKGQALCAYCEKENDEKAV